LIKSTVSKAIQVVGSFAKNKILSVVEDYKVKELIRKSQSSKRPEKILAKAKLKKHYPEVYSVLEE
jgi:hypothetical protein